MKEFAARDRRAFLMSMTSLLALSGCGNLIGPDQPPGQIYVLAPELGSPSDQRKLTFQLAVAQPEASASLATDRIALRRDLTLDYFAAAQWSDSAPKLVENLLVEALEKIGALGSVARDVDGLRADYVLQTELNAFEARYDHGDAPPTIVVGLTARIVSTVHHEIVKAREFGKDVSARANNVPSVVSAFDAALSQLLPEIAAWALAVAEAAQKKQI